jgi:hypothetical protein
MPGLVSVMTLGFVALGVFIPLFVIGLIMLKSIRDAFVVAIVFAVGATVGFTLAATAGIWAVGRAVDSDVRSAMYVAFASAGAAAGGAVAVWALFRHRSPPI